MNAERVRIQGLQRRGGVQGHGAADGRGCRRFEYKQFSVGAQDKPGPRLRRGFSAASAGANKQKKKARFLENTPHVQKRARSSWAPHQRCLYLPPNRLNLPTERFPRNPWCFPVHSADVLDADSADSAALCVLEADSPASAVLQSSRAEVSDSSSRCMMWQLLCSTVCAFCACFWRRSHHHGQRQAQEAAAGVALERSPTGVPQRR